MFRSIVHLDADAFFASVEQAADPRLRGKAVAVGGEKRGIIASASYEARKFGVYTPMPTMRARKLCPKLIVLPGDFEKYERFSRWMFSYAYDFTPDVEITSIDEGYFDLSGTRKSPVAIADTIRQAIRQALKISVSEGIGGNKLVSQIASKLHKPAAFAEVPPGQERPFLYPLPNRWLPGIGPQTATRLNAAGLARIGQIAAMPVDLLHLLVGSMAATLRQFANGIDERPLLPARDPQKTFSQQETFASDLTDEEYIEATLCRMADHLFAAVRREGRSVRTLTVKVRYNDRAEDQVSESLTEPTDLETDVYGRLHTLLRQAWKRRVSLRLVSLKLSNVYEIPFRIELPLEAVARRQAARVRLALAIDGLRQTRGHSVILRGHDFRLLAPPTDALTATARTAGRSAVAAPASRSADFLSAVSQVSNLQPSESIPTPVSNSKAVLTGSQRYSRQEVCATPEGRPSHDFLNQLPSAPSTARRRLLPAKTQVSTYAPLRTHSYYSFLDSTLSPSALVELAKQQGLPAVALTDTGNLHGAVEFTLAAKELGVKPILGLELLVESHPLLLYVESARGYHQLCRLLSRHAERQAAEATVAAVATQQRRPFRREEFVGFTEGLLAVSNDTRWADLFPDRFYQLVTARDQECRFPAVACPAIHYATPDDRLKYEVVQSIRTLTLLREKHPEKRFASKLHFRSPVEMTRACRKHPEWLRHTLEIAERCHFEMPFGKPQFPAFAPPDGSPPSEFLRRLVLEGLRQRYGSRADQYRPQVMEELSIINEVGYEEYFLITWDFLQECRRRGIEWITRGSAADSLVCYCLGISGVCPIRFDLYFRRFLNKERMALHKLPDIDIDFAHDFKDRVVELIFEKYGREHCAVVGGFSTFQARSAFAEVAKVLGVAEREVRKFTEHFPWGFGGGWVPDDPAPHGGAGLMDLLRASPETRDLPFDEEPYHTALLMAEFLDGFPRYPKMHPCGLVLSRQPMHELTPTFIANKGYATTHFDMDAVEAIGLVKMDILAQGGLAAMRDVKAMLDQRGIQIDCEQCVARDKVSGQILLGDPAAPEPWHDPNVWEMIAGGHARAVHHIESPAMTGLCRMSNVRDIDGLIAIVSVIRPGAANEGKKLTFTRRYQGLEPVTYPHPSLEDCLKSTYGLVVYEEHILQLCEAFAGLPPGRADVLRRALNKQKRGVIHEIRGEFFASARARGHSLEKTEEVWALVTGFAGYAFCKAHSTAYGVEAYQSAWLKRYFPAEFMAAVLTNGKGFYDPLVYVLECHRLGIRLLPPWVNEPGPAFTVTSPSPPLGERAGVRAPASRSADFQSAVSQVSNLQPSESIPTPISDSKTVPPGSRRYSRQEVCATTDNLSESAQLPRSLYAIRVPVTRIKGLTERTTERLVQERARGEFQSLLDFYRRVAPSGEELEAMIRAGAFDGFGETRTHQFWQAQYLVKTFSATVQPAQGWLLPPAGLEKLPEVTLNEPTRHERLQWETELFGYAVSGHPLELFDNVAWDTYCPVSRLGEFVGQTVTTCGLIVEQRTHHQITGEPMKFLTLADWTGMVETELFAPTYRSYGLATVRYPVLEITASVEPFENGHGFSLRVLRAGKPRTKA